MASKELVENIKKTLHGFSLTAKASCRYFVLFVPACGLAASLDRVTVVSLTGTSAAVSSSRLDMFQSESKT